MSNQSTRHREASPRWWRRWRKPVHHIALVPEPIETAHALKARVAERDAAEAREVPYLGMDGGHIEKRPGSDFHDTLLAPCNPHSMLTDFNEGDQVVLNELAEGDVSGLYGRVSRIVRWRAARPIGVRLHGDGWARLVWCEPHELEILRGAAADTLVLAATPTGDDLPLMGGAR